MSESPTENTSAITPKGRTDFEALSVNGLDVPVYIHHEEKFFPKKPTIIRLSNHATDPSRNYLMQDRYRFASCNILDIPDVRFENLRSIPEKIFEVIRAIETLGTEVVAIEPPFTDMVRLSHLFRQIQIGGGGIEILYPVFDEQKGQTNDQETKNLRHRPIAGYEFFRTKFPLDTEEQELTERAEKPEKPCILRYSNHNLQDAANSRLQETYGENTKVIGFKDVDFRNDTQIIINRIKSDIKTYEQQGYTIVAIDLTAPPHIIAHIVYSRLLHDKGIDLLKAKYQERRDAESADPGELTKGFRGGVREILDFESYKKLLPSIAFAELLKPKKEFMLPNDNRFKTLRPFAKGETKNRKKLEKLQKWTEQLLNLISDQDWNGVNGLIGNNSINSLLEEANLTLTIKPHPIDTYLDLDSGSDDPSSFEGKNINVEWRTLTDAFREDLKKRNVNTEDLESNLKIINILAFAEEVLHALQMNRQWSHLLSSKGEMLYSNPYLEGRQLKKKQRHDISLPEEQLALEYDILCIFSDFGIPVPALVWYGYQRLDVLSLTLGKNYSNTKSDKLDERVSNLNIGGELIIDDSMAEKATRVQKANAGKNIHCIIRKEEKRYMVNRPKDNSSGWGTFYLDENNYWQLIPNEGTTFLPKTKLRIGPSIVISLP